MAGHPGHGRARVGMHTSSRRSAVEAPALVATSASTSDSSSPSDFRAAISERVGESRFGLWFGDGVQLGLSGDGNALEVRVPDAFFRDWIQRHYTTSLLEAAEAVAGRPLQLSIRIRDEGEPPLGDVVEPAPPYHEPEAEPRRRQTVKIPMPGNPKAPLSFPTVSPGGPEPGPPLPPPRKNLPGPRNRLQASSAGQTASATATVPASTGSSPGRPSRQLDGFMTGPGNRLAHAAAREMAQSAGAAFNPLVIHGGVGLGKTHLLEAIGHALRRSHPGMNIVQLTAEGFTNSFLEAMRTGTLSSFRSRFRAPAG